eukprot:PhM_4_TR17465/c0_g1_i1/m.62692
MGLTFSVRLLLFLPVVMFAIISACVYSFLLTSGDRTTLSMLRPLEQAKAELIASKIDRTVVPTAKAIDRHKIQSVQRPSELASVNATSSTRDRFMFHMIRDASIYNSSSVFHIFKVNATRWGYYMCGLVKGSFICGLRLETTESMYLVKNVSTLELAASTSSLAKMFKTEMDAMLTSSLPFVTAMDIRTLPSPVQWVPVSSHIGSDNKKWLVTAAMARVERARDSAAWPRVIGIEFVLRNLNLFLTTSLTGSPNEFFALIDRSTGNVLVLSTRHGIVLGQSLTDLQKNSTYAQVSSALFHTLKQFSGTWQLASNISSHFSAEGLYVAARTITIPSGIEWVIIAGTDMSYHLKPLRSAQAIALILCTTVGCLSVIISIFILVNFLHPLRTMVPIVKAAATMDVSFIEKLPRSRLTEVSSLQGDVENLVSQFKEYKKYIPEHIIAAAAIAAAEEERKEAEEIAKDLDMSKSVTHAAMNALTETFTMDNLQCVTGTANEMSPTTKANRLKTIEIDLHYTGTSGAEKESVFSFSYMENDPKIFDRLLTVVRNNAGFEFGLPVLIVYRRENAVWIPIQSTTDFIVASGVVSQRLECRVTKNVQPQIIILLTCGANIASMISTTTFASSLVRKDKMDLAIALITSLSAQLLTNLILGNIVIRKMCHQNTAIADWVLIRRKDVRFARFLGLFNVLNLESMSSNYTFFGFALYAPILADDLRIMERFSVAGFVLGPVVSFVINVLHVLGSTDSTDEKPSGSDSEVSVTSYMSLCFGIVSLCMTGLRLIVLSSFNTETKKGKAEDVDAVMKLQERPCTIAHCVLNDLDELASQAETDEELLELDELCKAYYDAAFRCARRFSGNVFHFHGSEVGIVFNAVHDTLNHEALALQCAFALHEVKGVCCGIARGIMRVGHLGPKTRRTFQIISPMVRLAQGLAHLAVRQQQRVLSMKAVADASRSGTYAHDLFCRVHFERQRYHVYSARVRTTDPIPAAQSALAYESVSVGTFCAVIESGADDNNDDEQQRQPSSQEMDDLLRNGNSSFIVSPHSHQATSLAALTDSVFSSPGSPSGLNRVCSSGSLLSSNSNNRFQIHNKKQLATAAAAATGSQHYTTQSNQTTTNEITPTESGSPSSTCLVLDGNNNNINNTTNTKTETPPQTPKPTKPPTTTTVSAVISPSSPPDSLADSATSAIDAVPYVMLEEEVREEPNINNNNKNNNNNPFNFLVGRSQQQLTIAKGQSQKEVIKFDFSLL